MNVLWGQFGGGGVNRSVLQANDDAAGLSRRTLEMDDPSGNAQQKCSVVVDTRYQSLRSNGVQYCFHLVCQPANLADDE